VLLLPLAATAKEAAPLAADQNQDIHVLGRLNVNTATREQLLRVPGLDATAVDVLLTSRARAAITELPPLPDEARAHLKTEGTSTLYRIRQNPLHRLDDASATSRR
jgi:hypothetical protein